ncbi:TetR family transcriptional regulator [Sneathiella sp. P13V-1]|uniref:TetR/AcrR family transcriptional regulator n=1 Tax=Sneathiella sp. P13V-1 TaxID=2697366 RepID=UPI00187B9FDE|nr:TetR family transcriptional regulator [Sneathiella sp. P13V-1]
MAKINTRDQIVVVADNLFYQRGFEITSFADIADVVKISRGNFYYHFKTKDQILDAVIAKRLADRQAMLAQWEIEGETPADRIRSFINILIVNKEKIKSYGCPIGTLSTELAKLNHDAANEANELFTLFRTWLHRQFELMGRKNDADQLAMHVLAHSQGVATLSNAFGEETFLQNEVNQIMNWLSEIEQQCAA